MIASLQDRMDQSRELGVRADLEEGSCTRSIHRLDLGHELDRPTELAREQGAGRVGTIRIRLARRVGEDRNCRDAQRD